jgi:SAM-dependent methyltransferase
MSTAKFDPNQYKQTTRAQWESAAPAWDRWDATLADWLDPATEVMLNLAGVTRGATVLDVAAGAGGQTLNAARRVGPTGRVLATDISPAIQEYAAARMIKAGLGNVGTAEMDGENLAIGSQHYDAVISRLGIIYFPDQQRALAQMKAVLRPGGRIAAIVYGPAEANGFFSVPVSIIRRHAQLPPPVAGQPGPFSLGGHGVAVAAFQQAGFTDVTAEAIDAPLRLPSAEECLRFEQESFGALHQMLSHLAPPDREAAWTEVGQALQDYEESSGFVGPCQLMVIAGMR